MITYSKNQEKAVILNREISIPGEGDGPAFAFASQLWAWLFTIYKNIFSNSPSADSMVD